LYGTLQVHKRRNAIHEKLFGYTPKPTIHSLFEFVDNLELDSTEFNAVRCIAIRFNIATAVPICITHRSLRARYASLIVFIIDEACCSRILY